MGFTIHNQGLNGLASHRFKIDLIDFAIYTDMLFINDLNQKLFAFDSGYISHNLSLCLRRRPRRLEPVPNYLCILSQRPTHFQLLASRSLRLTILAERSVSRCATSVARIAAVSV